MSAIHRLSIEHGVIRRMLGVIKRELKRIEAGGEPAPEFVAVAMEFFSLFADCCHQGKEDSAGAFLQESIDVPGVSTPLGPPRRNPD